MKARFPLFARLLLWFFLNLLLLAAGLLVMVRAQFGSLNNWLLPQSSQDQIQAMTTAFIDDLAHSPRDSWGDKLNELGDAYKMDFALYDSRGNWLDGSKFQPPDDVHHAMIFAQRPGGAPAFRPQPEQLPPPPQGGEDRPPKHRGPLPEFPKSVLHSAEAYWLLVRLPPEPLQMDGPVTLIGRTPKLGLSPLLFNPDPWFAVAAGIVIFSALFWLPMARDLTRAISKMTHATESIAEGRFDVQLSGSRSDELGRLGSAINRMAARLKEFVTGQKRFLGDAAHELCSPLARMEVALGILEERGDEKSRPYVRDVREEVTHMRKLANELLSFSKSALLEHQIALAPVNLADVVDAAIRQEKSGAFPIEVRVPRDLRAQGNFDLLLRALGNLLRNALRYSGGGMIFVRAWSERGQVFVAVADEGPGLAPTELERVFDPFYRADPSRTAATGGVGLGLAIVKSCVEACGGVVSAANRQPHGLEVSIRLNAARA